jgi:Holliday junction resolvase RusA-like endonuclease
MPIDPGKQEGKGVSNNISAFSFSVPGNPQPLHRHRTSTRNGKPEQYDDPRNEPNRQAIAWAAKVAGAPGPVTGPVSVLVFARLVKPKSSKREQPTVKPDIDNYAKLVLDALNGIAWKDDSQVVEIRVKKMYAVNYAPCTAVHVYYWDREK